MVGWLLSSRDYEQIGEPVTIEGETYIKYRVPSQGNRELWALNNNEVWYPDEKFFEALDIVQEVYADD